MCTSPGGSVVQAWWDFAGWKILAFSLSGTLCLIWQSSRQIVQLSWQNRWVNKSKQIAEQSFKTVFLKFLPECKMKLLDNKKEHHESTIPCPCLLIICVACYLLEPSACFASQWTQWLWFTVHTHTHLHQWSNVTWPKSHSKSISVPTDPSLLHANMNITTSEQSKIFFKKNHPYHLLLWKEKYFCQLSN